MEITEIKRSLIEACETGDIKIFKPAFFSDKVKMDGLSKEKSFKFFKKMLNTAHYEVEGNLYLKIRLPKEEDEFTEAYGFFSKNHLHSRLCVHVTETNEFIEIDVIPF